MIAVPGGPPYKTNEQRVPCLFAGDVYPTGASGALVGVHALFCCICLERRKLKGPLPFVNPERRYFLSAGTRWRLRAFLNQGGPGPGSGRNNRGVFLCRSGFYTGSCPGSRCRGVPGKGSVGGEFFAPYPFKTPRGKRRTTGRVKSAWAAMTASMAL